MPLPTLETLPYDLLYEIAENLLEACSLKGKYNSVVVSPVTKSSMDDGWVRGFRTVAALSSVSRRMRDALDTLLYKLNIKYCHGSVLTRNARLGNAENIRKAILLGVDIDTFGKPFRAYNEHPTTRTALHLSVLHGHDDVLQLLLEHNAQVDRRSIEWNCLTCPFVRLFRGFFTTSVPGVFNFTALHYALITHKTRAAKLLVEAGASLVLDEAIQLHALHLSSAHSYLHLAKKLLSLPGQDPNVRDSNGNTPLHYIAFVADAGPMIRLLLSHGADINATNIHGQTPLCFSLRTLYWHGSPFPEYRLGFSLTSAKALLLEGAKPLPDADGRTPLFLMYHERGGQQARPVCKSCKSPSLRHKDWMSLRYELMGMLLDSGDEIEAECPLDRRGLRTDTLPGTNFATPLVMAARQGDDKATELLLQRGADPNHRPTNHTQPIWNLRMLGWDGQWSNEDFRILQMLLNNGAEFPEVDDKGGALWFHRVNENTRRRCLEECQHFGTIDIGIMALLGSDTVNEAARRLLQSVLYSRVARDRASFSPEFSRRCLAKFMAQLLESGATLRLGESGGYGHGFKGPTMMIKISTRVKLAWQRALETQDEINSSKDDSIRELQHTTQETWDLVSNLLRRIRLPSVRIVTCIRVEEHPTITTTQTNLWTRLVVTKTDEVVEADKIYEADEICETDEMFDTDNPFDLDEPDEPDAP